MSMQAFHYPQNKQDMKEKINLNGIKNIIFDFGNVLLNIDPSLSAKAFTELGIKEGVDFWGSPRSFELRIGLEKGTISPEDFRKGAMEMLVEGVTSQHVDEAWNALLLDLPGQRVEMLKRLKSHYRLFLLSNSNQIHYEEYMPGFEEKFGFPMGDLFEKLWFSHQLKMIKPDIEIYKHVLKDAGLNPAETLFIDDTLVNVEVARSLGIKAWHLEPEMEISELL